MVPSVSTAVKIFPGSRNSLRLFVPYHIPTIEIIKKLPSRKWNPDDRCWEVPDERETCEFLVKALGPTRLLDCNDMLKRLAEELRSRNYSRRTIDNYSHAVSRFLALFPKRPEQATATDLKQYFIGLLEREKMSARTVNLAEGAIRFFIRMFSGCLRP